MKIGDLIKHTSSGDLGLIVQADDWGYTLVKWFDEEYGSVTEDAALYNGELEVISESR
jgi:hypothetical protein